MIYTISLSILLINPALLFNINRRLWTNVNVFQFALKSTSVFGENNLLHDQLKPLLIDGLGLDIDRAEHLLSVLLSAGFRCANDLRILGMDFIDRPEVLSTVLKQDFEINSIDAHQIRAAIIRLIDSKENELNSLSSIADNSIIPVSTKLSVKTSPTNATMTNLLSKPLNIPLFKKFIVMPDKVCSYDQSNSVSNQNSYGITNDKLTPKVLLELDSFHTVSQLLIIFLSGIFSLFMYVTSS